MRIHIGGGEDTRRAAKSVGLIGADATSLTLARRIAAAGQRVALHAPCGASLLPRIARIEHAATTTDIAADCDIVLSMIEDTAALRALLIGGADRPGLGADMAPGSVLVDLGVRPARETQALLGLLGTRGVAVIDAAVIGPLDGEGATAQDLTVLVGGYPDAVDHAAPVLNCIGRVERTGPLGSAHTAAALMGYVEAAQVVAEQEALNIGRALGLTDATLARVAEAPVAPENVVRLARRLRIAGRMAADRGVNAEVIEFTGRKLPDVGDASE
ncbi:MAG: NAD(P)-binding domain-containing protein [Hyphomicrobium sp.]